MPYITQDTNFERYVVTNDISGEFYITGYDYMTRQPVEGKTRLHICKNCLTYLNYKGYSKPGNYSAFKNFDLILPTAPSSPTRRKRERRLYLGLANLVP